ncbi:hypothetical protein DICA4_E30548 [Diutina catenulata]
MSRNVTENPARTSTGDQSYRPQDGEASTHTQPSVPSIVALSALLKEHMEKLEKMEKQMEELKIDMRKTIEESQKPILAALNSISIELNQIKLLLIAHTTPTEPDNHPNFDANIYRNGKLASTDRAINTASGNTPIPAATPETNPPRQFIPGPADYTVPAYYEPPAVRIARTFQDTPESQKPPYMIQWLSRHKYMAQWCDSCGEGATFIDVTMSLAGEYISIHSPEFQPSEYTSAATFIEAAIATYRNSRSLYESYLSKLRMIPISGSRLMDDGWYRRFASILKNLRTDVRYLNKEHIAKIFKTMLECHHDPPPIELFADLLSFCSEAGILTAKSHKELISTCHKRIDGILGRLNAYRYRCQSYMPLESPEPVHY